MAGTVSMRASGDRATNPAVTITERDRHRLRRIGLYYGIRPSTLARIELPPAVWAPWAPTSSTPEARDRFERHCYAIRRRLTRLKRLEARPAAHVGPLVGSATAWADQPHSWHLTQTGMTAAGLPWTTSNTLDFTGLAHSQAVADVHTQLEFACIHALSPRETASKVDREGHSTPTHLSSRITESNGARRSTRPDLAILDADGDRFIAIDVAGYRRTSADYWSRKIRAYRGNTAVRSVWILCATNTSARAVSRAAETVLGKPGSFPLRLRLITPEGDGFLPLDTEALPAPMTDDLAEQGCPTVSENTLAV